MNDKDLYQSTLFENRLAKKYRLLKKWARKQRVTCYRLYDRDIPEIPLACDLYELLPPEITTPIEAARFMNNKRESESENDQAAIVEIYSRQYLHMYLYERPYEKPEEEEKEWLSCMAKAASKVLHIDESHIIIKARRHAKGGVQYNSASTPTEEKGLTIYAAPKTPVIGSVQEQGQLFNINLSDYLDSGLFFDHRPLRSRIRDSASGKSVLNLFCYTGSFSVYAAEGKAKRIESVDLSNTYLSWAKKNMELNGFDVANEDKYIFTRADVLGFLNQKNAEVPSKNESGKSDGTNRFDIIILDPPTFSNSKRTQTTLDINRDWFELVNKCAALLTPKGNLYFSTNSRRLSFDENLVLKTREDGCTIKCEDITESTIPEDYKSTKIHRCWKISVSPQEKQ